MGLGFPPSACRLSSHSQQTGAGRLQTSGRSTFRRAACTARSHRCCSACRVCRRASWRRTSCPPGPPGSLAGAVADAFDVQMPMRSMLPRSWRAVGSTCATAGAALCRPCFPLFRMLFSLMCSDCVVRNQNRPFRCVLDCVLRTTRFLWIPAWIPPAWIPASPW